MILRGSLACAFAACLILISWVLTRAEDRPAQPPPTQTGTAVGVNHPVGGTAPACEPMPTEAAAIKALAQHVPSLGVTPDTTIIPDAQPIALHLTFPTNLASGSMPDFGVVGTLDGQSSSAFPIVSWKPS